MIIRLIFNIFWILCRNISIYQFIVIFYLFWEFFRYFCWRNPFLFVLFIRRWIWFSRRFFLRWLILFSRNRRFLNLIFKGFTSKWSYFSRFRHLFLLFFNHKCLFDILWLNIFILCCILFFSFILFHLIIIVKIYLFFNYSLLLNL